MVHIYGDNMGSPFARVTVDGELVVNVDRSIDETTNAIVTIDYAHYKIHNGNHYFLRNYNILGSGIGSSLFFDITTPSSNNWIHLFYNLMGTKVTELKMWEGATLSGGTTETLYNNNRNSTNITDLIIKSQPQISGTTPTSGIVLSTSSFGLSTGQGATTDVEAGEVSRGKELILKSGTTYLFQITSATADNLISYIINWYEHTNLV